MGGVASFPGIKRPEGKTVFVCLERILAHKREEAHCKRRNVHGITVGNNSVCPLPNRPLSPRDTCGKKGRRQFAHTGADLLPFPKC